MISSVSSNAVWSSSLAVGASFTSVTTTVSVPFDSRGSASGPLNPLSRTVYTTSSCPTKSADGMYRIDPEIRLTMPPLAVVGSTAVTVKNWPSSSVGPGRSLAANTDASKTKGTSSDVDCPSPNAMGASLTDVTVTVTRPVVLWAGWPSSVTV